MKKESPTIFCHRSASGTRGEKGNKERASVTLFEKNRIRNAVIEALLLLPDDNDDDDHARGASEAYNYIKNKKENVHAVADCFPSACSPCMQSVSV